MLAEELGQKESTLLNRREFGKRILFASAAAAGAVTFPGCSGVENDSSPDASASKASLPAAQPNPESEFGVDLNVNVATIDSFLGRDDVVYRDMRMLFDPADYASMGGSPNLEFCLEGFKIVPFPYLGTLAALPVSGAYDGKCLYRITWGEGLEVLDARPVFQQSEQILEDLFPKDKQIFLVCGGGGYAAMARALLVHLGWDADRVYNMGAMWEYEGEHPVELMTPHSDGSIDYRLWRADVAMLEFDQFDAV